MKKTKIIAVDTETTGLNVYGGDRPFMVSFTNEEGESKEVHFGVIPHSRKVQIDKGGLDEVKEICEDDNIIKVFHNVNFDVGMLDSIGVAVRGTYYDTIVMAHCENSGRATYALKPLAKQLLGINTDDETDLKKAVISARRQAKKKGWKISDAVEADYWLAMDLAAVYAKRDTERTIGLYKYFVKMMHCDVNYWNLVHMEMKLLKTIRNMSSKGITIDQKRLRELESYYNEIILSAEKGKAELGYADLNPRSNKQMKKVFYEDLKLPAQRRKRKDKNGVMSETKSCDSKALEAWAETVPLAKLLVNMKIAGHELSAFIEPFKQLSANDGLLHPNYLTCGPVTGRLSCTKPNLMNISNSKTTGDVKLRARELFVPREGCVLYFPDYSQIEVWLSAFISKDKVMMEALINGLDMHENLAVKHFGHEPDYEDNVSLYRKKAKFGTFCTIYGGGVSAIKETLKCSYSEAESFRKAFFDTYSGLALYAKDLAEVGKKHGVIVDNFGRNYPVDRGAPHKTLNYMVQGSAAGVMKRALINVDALLKMTWPEANLLLTIHDEICVEVPLKYHSKRLMREIVSAMQGDFHEYFDMPRPFEVSMAWTKTRWSEKKEIKI